MHLTVVGQVSAGSSGDTVGGLAGQMEPQVIVQYSESAIEQLCTELDELETLVNKALNSAGAASSAVSGQLSGLLGSVASATGTLASNIQAINTQVGVINGLIQQSVEEVQSKTDEAPVTDISDEDAEQATTGRISASVNYGEVKGDGNVAGIAGSVAIEYDFDPEDDLTESGEQSLNFEYNTLAMVLDCVNKGAVTAKKDNAGGIVGRMDVGAGAEESVVSGCCLWSSYCCWRRWARPGTSWAGLCSRPTTPTASCATSRAARTAR